MNELSDRLRAAMTSAGMSQADLARACGVSDPTVSNWLSGKTKSLKASTAIAAAAALHVDVVWLESGRGDPTMRGNISTAPRPIIAVDDETPLFDDDVEVPRLTLKLSAGSGRLTWEIDEKGRRNRFRSGWCKQFGYKPEKLVTVAVEGDSMRPTIPDGASVTINTAIESVKNGRPHAIDYLGEYFIKRLFRQPDGSILVRSDNPDKARYPDWTIAPEYSDSLRVLGEAVSMATNL